MSSENGDEREKVVGRRKNKLTKTRDEGQIIMTSGLSEKKGTKITRARVEPSVVGLLLLVLNL